MTTKRLKFSISTFLAASAVGFGAMQTNAWGLVSAIFFVIAGISALATIIIVILPLLKRLPFVKRNEKSILVYSVIILIIIGLLIIKPAGNWITTIGESHPNPQEIINDVDNERPSLQDQLRKGYKGQDVKWSLNFQGLKDNDGTTEITAYPVGDNSIFIIVSFVVDTEQYPKFSTMGINTRFKVQGEINEVSYNTIKLDITQIIFP